MLFDEMLPFYIKNNAIYLNIKAIPGAKQNKLGEVFLDSNNCSIAKIYIKAPPVDNKANEMIIDFLSLLFKISKTNIKIEKGEKSKNKIVVINGETEELLKKMKTMF